MQEMDALATAMEIPFLVDIVKTNLDILDTLSPEASTSMQRDIWAGKDSELERPLYLSRSAWDAGQALQCRIMR